MRRSRTVSARQLCSIFETTRFDLNLVVARDDDEHVAIFRVVDGRTVEVWNCGDRHGVWA